MFMPSVPSFLLASLLFTGGFHVPHDPVDDLAIGPNFRSGQGSEVVACMNSHSRVMRSFDQGLSWEALAGDGLQRVQCMEIEYRTHATRPGYFIGTADGVYFYDPIADTVARQSAGLPSSDNDIISLSAPRSGVGIVIALTSNGTVFGWEESSQSWLGLLQTGLADDYGKIAIAPWFDDTAAVGPDQAMAVATAGVLHQSDDGGTTWTIQSQFSTPATTAADWTISALAYAISYSSNGILLVGRSRENLAAGNPWGDEGELWRTADYGVTFTFVMPTISRITSLHATGPSAFGGRHFFMSIYYFPDRNNPAQAVGLRRSDDLGLSWSDFGNWQDLILEEEVGDGAAERWKPLMGFATSLDYKNDRMVYFGRSEGLFRSLDGGKNWLQTRVRSERFVRNMTTTVDADGSILAFGGTYGSGTIKARFQSTPSGLVPVDLEVLDEGKITYQKPIAASPNYAQDGMVAVGGATGISLWFDPAKNGRNPWGKRGWLETADNIFGYVRTIVVSPHFDASTPTSLDMSFYWSTRSASHHGPGEQTWRTMDCGKTLELIDTWSDSTGGSGDLPHLSNLAFAPTYDASDPITTTDLYGTAGPHLFRLDGSTWTWLGTATSRLSTLSVAPDFDRDGMTAAGPVLWATLISWPYLVRITDDNGGQNPATFDEIPTDGMDCEVKGLAVPPDLPATGILYAATTGSGVKTIQVGGWTPGSPDPIWNTTGSGYPSWVTMPVDFSPGFLTDQSLLAGTDRGFVHSQAGSAWQVLSIPSFIDDRDPGFTFYSPNASGNTQPTRPWRWLEAPFDVVEKRFPVQVSGVGVAYTKDDGSWFRWQGIASGLTVRTFEGPKLGWVDCQVLDFNTGAVLSQIALDLETGTVITEKEIVLPAFPAGPVELVVTTTLAMGESFALDGLKLLP